METVTENSVLNFSPIASFQKLGGGAVVLKADDGQLYTVNETAVAFLSRLDGKLTVSAILDEMTQEFDIDRATLAKDISNLSQQLLSEGIVLAGSLSV